MHDLAWPTYLLIGAQLLHAAGMVAWLASQSAACVHSVHQEFADEGRHFMQQGDDRLLKTQEQEGSTHWYLSQLCIAWHVASKEVQKMQRSGLAGA